MTRNDQETNVLNTTDSTPAEPAAIPSRTGSSPSGDKQRLLIRQIYTAEIGTREETGRNDGKRVEAYLAYTGLPKGNPWCAAFISWTYGKAGLPEPRTAWSPALFPADKVIWRNGKQVRSLPQSGDIFGIWFPNKKRIAHAGFVDHWTDKWLITVEGNTNPEGSREGDGVYKRRRWVKGIYAVASWL
ncbi:peptidoglycan-binding protein [Pedobacter sp. SYSU D00535]|uniref:peptidoglycan-binding protein n=1 Tax=Pedobacter sp. SYSU D00535 TaxID=2810308 RepID=UPI001F6240B2|nr:peptidoglycan-binding protein [Pedobacter sp. SYSU D00535]